MSSYEGSEDEVDGIAFALLRLSFSIKLLEYIAEGEDVEVNPGVDEDDGIIEDDLWYAWYCCKVEVEEASEEKDEWLWKFGYEDEKLCNDRLSGSELW